LLNVWSKYFYAVQENIQERSRQGYWKSRKRDCVDIGHPRSGYVPLSHGRGGRRYRRERGEGLRKRDTRSSKLEERERESTGQD
jgi:hypothetical protein